MQPVEARFSFRFESGPREKEWIALREGCCSVGRLPKNTVQVSDASVSGRHAELRVDSAGVTLVDLGSTNGTRVEGERIETLLLGHGDGFQFGSVRAIFHDAQVGGLPDAEASELTLEEPEQPSSAARTASGGLGAASFPAQDGARVSAEALARSGSGSKLGLVVLVLLSLGAAGFGAWMFINKGASGAAAEAVRVAQVPGNLLDDYSFEGESHWSNAEAAPQAFFVDRSFAMSGSFGLGVLLEGPEWALAASDALSLGAGQLLTLVGFSSARGGALGRLGLELLPSDPEESSVFAWAPAQAAVDFTESKLSFKVPAGIKAARVLVAAKGASAESEVGFDDISVLIESAGGSAPCSFEEYELSVLGAGGSSAILSRSGRILFTGISTSSWNYEGLSGDAQASWSARASATGFELRLAAPASAGARCLLLAGSSRPLSPDSKSPPYLASMGQGGYRSHAIGFKRDNASHLLAGGGANLMRFSTAPNTTLSALNFNGQAALALELGGASQLNIQLGFDDERGSAESLALRARGAAAKQRAGEALGAWLELLASYPIDASLIAEAESVSASILSSGHARIAELEVSLEAADFFQLRDAYERCQRAAEELGREYKQTEIENQAKAIVARIEAALGALDSSGKLGAAGRLRGVLSALDATSEPELAARLSAALAAEQNTDEDERK